MGYIYLAALLLVIGVAVAVIGPRPAILGTRGRRDLREQAEDAMEKAPGISTYRRYQKKVRALTMLSDYVGTFWHDLALFLKSNQPLPQALASAADTAPQEHPWRAIVSDAERMVRPGRDLPTSLGEELRAIGAVEIALDLAELSDVATEGSGAEIYEDLAAIADKMGDIADERAHQEALKRANRLPARMSVLMVLLFLPVAILINVGDALWEFLQVIGGIFR